VLSEPIRQRDPRLYERVEEIRREVIRLGRITGGPGVRINSTSAGVVVSTVNAHGPDMRARAADHSGGDLIALAQTQGIQDTDDWDRDRDDTRVAMQVITDVEYNNVTHNLSFRTRTLMFDRGGHLVSVGPESNLIIITTAVECPCRQTTNGNL